MQMYQKAAQLTPAWALPRIQMATQLQLQTRLEQAAAELETAVQLQPRSSQARWMLARVYRLLGRHADAERTALALIERNPNYAPIYYDLGEVYEAAGKTGPAVEVYNSYLQLAPNFADSAMVRRKVAALRTGASPTAGQPKREVPPPQPAVTKRTPPTLKRSNER
jgi:tetratricopeptide (TPR) repeat protein